MMWPKCPRAASPRGGLANRAASSQAPAVHPRPTLASGRGGPSWPCGRGGHAAHGAAEPRGKQFCPSSGTFFSSFASFFISLPETTLLHGRWAVHHGSDPRDPGAAGVSRYPQREPFSTKETLPQKNTVARQPPCLVQRSSATSVTQNTKARFSHTPGEGDAIRARSSLLPER